MNARDELVKLVTTLYEADDTHPSHALIKMTIKRHGLIERKVDDILASYAHELAEKRHCHDPDYCDHCLGGGHSEFTCNRCQEENP